MWQIDKIVKRCMLLENRVIILFFFPLEVDPTGFNLTLLLFFAIGSLSQWCRSLSSLFFRSPYGKSLQVSIFIYLKSIITYIINFQTCERKYHTSNHEQDNILPKKNKNKKVDSFKRLLISKSHGMPFCMYSLSFI